jgi:feruloyl esterase
MVPGLGHGIGSFLLSWDNVATLDQWVEQGTAPPDAPVAVDANPGSKARSRPLCVWPTWPKYRGSGSLNDAASFECAK